MSCDKIRRCVLKSTAKNNTRSFAKTFAELTENDGDLWRIDRKTPTLGDNYDWHAASGSTSDYLQAEITTTSLSGFAVPVPEK